MFDFSLPVTALVTLLFGLIAFRVSLKFAHKKKLYDIPSSRRRHSRPIPIVGGATVFAVWLVGLGIYAAFRPSWFFTHAPTFLPIAVSLGILIGLGLVDDLRGVGPAGKLLFQTAAAINVIIFEPTVHAFCLYWVGRFNEFGIGAIVWPATTIWLVGLSNAINLVDGLDGLAGGISLLVCGSLAWLGIGWGPQGEFVFPAMALMMVSLATFLKHNWNPAEIFLGDNGSLPLGFLIGTMSLMAPLQQRSWIQIISICVMMGYPILDMGLATLRRYRKRHPLFKADRNHLHHRVLRMGLTVSQTAILLLSITAYLQLTSLCIVHFIQNEAGLVTSGLLFLVATAWSLFTPLYLLRAIERRRMERLASSTSDIQSAVKAVPVKHECVVAKIELEPLFEAGLFEEKERVHQIVSSLKLMLQSLIRKEDKIYLKNHTVHILYADQRYAPEILKKLEESLKDKLELFQTIYNIQYSLANLPLTFEKQELITYEAPNTKVAA